MVKIINGYVEGLQSLDGTINIFKGIPYARSKRWDVPKKFKSWAGTRECMRFSPNPIQSPQSPFLMWTEEFIIDTSTGYAEDSLTVNVYCPAKNPEITKEYPVIVYFHGGSFVSGGSSCEIYNGEQLARHGVIFVTVNFREGILGLLASSELSHDDPRKISGNYQILDQISALKWVKENIASFGGNPENVTIMGQSSGGASVCTLAVSPMARGLFHRVFSMSHETLNYPVSATTDEAGNMVNKNIYEPLKVCEAEGDKIYSAKMQTMSTDELLKMQQFHPYCIDGQILTCTFNEGVRQGLTDDYSFMITYTTDDRMLFAVMRDLAVKGQTDTKSYELAMREFFGEYADQAMKLYPFNGNPQEFVFQVSYERYIASVMMLGELRKGDTWMAEFAHVMPGPEASIWGAFHTSDVPYWLGYFTDKRKDYWRDEDYALGAELVSRLAEYARTGNPNAEGLSEWRPNSLYKIEAGNIHEAHLLDDEKYQFWRDFYCVK